MKERLEIIDFKYKVSIFTAIFFFVIATLSPISGIDLASYIVGKQGIRSIIDNINIYDGRIISGFLINFLSYNKSLFNILFSFLMGIFVYSCNSMMGYVKNKYYYLLPLIGTLLVSVFLFSYNYMSITGTVTYTFPSILIIYYFSKIWSRETQEFSKKEILFLSIISILISFSSIFISFVFLIGNIIYYLLNSKKISKNYLFTILINVSCLITSLFLIEKNLFYSNIEFTSYISKYIDFSFSKNILLLLISLIPINHYLNKKLENHIYKRVIITLISLILFFSLGYNFFYYIPVNLNLIINKYFGVFATENWYYIFYFILYILIFYLALNDIVKLKKTKIILSILISMSILLNLLSVVSPLWDEGCNILFVLTMVMISSILLKEIDFKIFPRLLTCFTAMLLIYYSSMFFVIKYIDKTRDDYIKEQLDKNENIIEVKANPIYLVWRYNPVNIFQQKDFKRYYEMPNDKVIKVKYFGIFREIENKVKE